MSGPLAPALGFAAIAFVAHATGLTLLLLLVAWRHAAETAALFGSDHPVASFVPRAVADGIVASWIMGPCAVAVSLLAFNVLCKLHRIHTSVADVGRVHLFACAAFVPATVPLVGLLALFAFPRFLHAASSRSCRSSPVGWSPASCSTQCWTRWVPGPRAL
jgi:hypothetical protein